jgi:DNA integrity scanning protein DisA with diadenylate cyclase activity
VTRRRTIEEVILLAVELVHEGREGRKIGTRAELDGAFLVEDDGTFVAAARFIDVDLESASDLPSGLGARHAAAASISGAADATAVVVSESATARVFSRGDLRAEIIPEFFRGGTDTFIAIESAEVRELPNVGLTIAYARGGA